MTLLFVANYPRDVGYAWHTITAVYAAVGRRLASAGVRTLFCYPTGRADADAIVFDYASTRRSLRALLAFLRLLRRERVRVLYLTDLETWSWRYLLFRLAGVGVVVHDRTSGARASRLPGLAKRLLHAVCGADLCIGISRFVVGRLVAVNGVPRGRVALVYNGIDLTRFAASPAVTLHALLGVSSGTRIVFASGRAQLYKGIPVLIEAAARLEAQGVSEIAFAYCGDGPALPQFRELAAARGLRAFHFLGRRDDVPELLPSAVLAVAPAVWEEAFGLTVVEAMAAGVPVVATRVGGVPELLEDGAAGLLVPPADPAALATAIADLLADEPRRRRMAERGRSLARARFSLERVVGDLTTILSPLLGITPGAAPPRRS